MPTVKQITAQGAAAYKAFVDTGELQAQPYEPETQNWEYWMAGFCDGADQDVLERYMNASLKAAGFTQVD